MKTPSRPWLLAGSFALFLAFAFLYGLSSRRDKPIEEPIYQGRTLTQWLYPNFEVGLDSTQRMVIKYWGPEAVPALRTILKSGSKADRALFWKLPRPLARHYPRERIERYQLKDHALSAVEHLGTNASPAAPEVIRILKDRTEPNWTRMRASNALRTLGLRKETLLPLLDGLAKDPDQTIARDARIWAYHIREWIKTEPDRQLWSRLTRGTNKPVETNFVMEPVFNAEEVGMRFRPGKP